MIESHNPPVGSPIRVAIADDDSNIRAALGSLISSCAGLKLVGEAGSTQEAVSLCGRLRPDVLLVDLKMPGGGGERAIHDIQRQQGNTRCIALTAYEDRGSLLRVIRAGAASYIVKGTPSEAIVATIEEVHRGQTQLSPEVTSQLVHELATKLQKEDRGSGRRQELVRQIRRAMALGGMSIAFQPVRRLSDLAVIGCEGLARFEPDEGRPVAAWFEHAAAVGLGADLEYAAAGLVAVAADGLRGESWLSFNMSPPSIMSGRFVPFFELFATSRLVVEITEHAPIDDYQPFCEELRGFRALGGKVAVDDAGSGYSSLQHVLELEPEVIKLDISLCRGVEGKVKQRAVISSLVALAEATNAIVVAEGVETEEQLRVLRELGVGHGQGFLLGRPEPGTMSEQPGSVLIADADQQ